MKPWFSLHHRTPQVWWHCAWNPSTKEGRPDSQGHHQLHVWDQPGPREIISKIKILKIAERYSQKVSTLIYNEDNVLVLSKLHKHTLSPRANTNVSWTQLSKTWVLLITGFNADTVPCNTSTIWADFRYCTHTCCSPQVDTKSLIWGRHKFFLTNLQQ